MVFDFGAAPGHLIRRAHQHSVASFTRAVGASGITPVQFALMTALAAEPGQDQASLAQRIALDAATTGQVIARLEARGLLQREADPSDRRRKRLALTLEGAKVTSELEEAVARAQDDMTSALTGQERAQLVALLSKMVRPGLPSGPSWRDPDLA